VVHSTAVPAGWVTAAACHSVVLPIPGAPVITAAAAPSRPADNTCWHAASSANLPSNVIHQA
jgi:hypothetical protein